MKSNSTEALKALLSFPFRDPKSGSKLLIGVALIIAGFIIPVFPCLFVTGYIARIMRSVASGDDPAMPEWNDWGGLLKDGFRLFAVSLLYMIPMIAISILTIGIIYGPMIFLALSDSSGYGTELLVFLSTMLWTFGIFFFVGIFMFFMLAYLVILPPMMIHTACKDDFGAAFQIGAWWRILWKNLVGFLAAAVITIGLYSVLAFGLQILYMTIIFWLLIPLLFAIIGFYMALTSSAAFAQAYFAGR